MSNYDDHVYHYDAKGIDRSETFSIVIGVITSLFPLSVVFIMLYKYEKILCGKSFMWYILMIAISDTVISISIAMGFPKNDTPACYAQGFLSIFFSRSTWLFTVVLVLQLFSVIVRHKHILNVTYMNAIVWSLNIILQILPLTTGDYYGQVHYDTSINTHINININNNFNNNKHDQTIDPGDPSDPLEKCYIGSRVYTIAAVNSEFFWDDLVFNYVLLASFFIIGTTTFMIFIYSYCIIRNNSSNLTLINHIKESKSTIILYPIAMLVSYVPDAIFAIYFNHYVKTKGVAFPGAQVTQNYLHAFGSIYGLLLTLIFYFRTKQARIEWYNIYRSITYKELHDLEKPLTENDALNRISDNSILRSSISDDTTL